MAESTGDTHRQRRRLSFEQIAQTQDTGDPVIRGALEDTGSWVTFTPDPYPDPEVIRIQHVESKHRGDMATMLDEIVTQLDQQTVRFMNPLDDLEESFDTSHPNSLRPTPGMVSGDASAPGQENESLLDRLHGFEPDVERFTHKGEEIEIESYVGEWDPDRDADWFDDHAEEVGADAP